MTAAQVVMDEASFWILVGLGVLSSVAALVAAVASWLATRQTRTALAQLETARQDREWQESSPIPRRASDMASLPDRPGSEASRADTAPTPFAPATPSPSTPTSSEPERVVRPAAPPRRRESIDDPDRPGTLASATAAARLGVAADPATLRTEPLSASRPSAVQAPPAPPAPPADEPAPLRTSEPAVSAPPAPVATAPAPVMWPLPNATQEPEPQPAPADAAPPRDPGAARLQRLSDPDPFVRIEAMEQLRSHPALVDALLRALHDDYPVVRRQAVRALKEAGGPQATRALLEVANQDPSAEVREEAVAALAAMLSDNRRGRPEAGAEA
jgi:hypothetical protein